MNFKQLSLAALCGMLILVSGTASAGIVLTEDFTGYADGDLSTANPLWIQHSPTPPSGTPMQVVSEAAVVTQDGGSGDHHKLFDGGASFANT